MKLKHHIAITFPIGVSIWLISNSIFYFVMALFLGILVDVDHILDYLIEERRFDLKHLFVKSYNHEYDRLTLCLHCYEYILVVWIICCFSGKYEFAIIFTVSYLTHMIPDQLSNNVRPFGYFFVYRAYRKFRMNDVFYPIE